ncbi:MAG: ATP-binding protein [bacterium]
MKNNKPWVDNIIHFSEQEFNIPATWLNSVFETAEIGICILNSEGNICGVNQTYCNLFGYEKEELMNNHFMFVLDPLAKDNAFKMHHQVMDNFKSVKAEFKVFRKDGSNFIAQIASKKIIDQENNSYAISTFTDISEKYYYELAFSAAMRISREAGMAKSSEELYKAIHDAIAQIMPANNFYIALYNEEDDSISFPFLIDEKDDDDSIIFDAKNNKGITAYILKTGKAVLLSNSEIANLIEANALEQYGEMPVIYLGIPLHLNGKGIGVLALQSYESLKAFNENDKKILELISQQVARYIERKKYEKELIEARMRAEDSNRIKSEFLAQMSHEIRTPINSILSFNSLLREELRDKVNEDLRESFQIIDSGGRRLIRTIDLLLNVSEVQTGTYKPSFSKIDLNKDILEFIVNEFKYQADNKNITLRYYLNTCNTLILGDGYTVAQMLINLIENAIKYTLEGRVWISVSMVNEKIKVEVKDTGIGISKEYLPHIFENFSQEETGYTRTYDGNGLGLSLVKKYAELNNAYIEVASEKGKGSTFSVFFEPFRK